MRYFFLLNLVFIITSLSIVTALEAPSWTTKELDDILSSSHIQFPDFTEVTESQDSIKERARDLIVATHKARTAIAAHIVDSDLKRTQAVKRAIELQAELMARAQLHLKTQLDRIGNVEPIEWDLHRGFVDGVQQTKKKPFAQRARRLVKVLARPHTRPLDSIAIGNRPSRYRRLYYQMNPKRAVRRWKIRQLVNKLSRPYTLPDATGQKVHVGPQSMEELRARFSKLTAIKSLESRTADAELRDAVAADRITNAPVIYSDLKIKLEPEEREETKEKEVDEKLPGSDGTPAPRRWAETFIQGPEGEWPEM